MRKLSKVWIENITKNFSTIIRVKWNTKSHINPKPIILTSDNKKVQSQKIDHVLWVRFNYKNKQTYKNK